MKYIFKFKFIIKEKINKFGLQIIYTDKDKKLYRGYKFKNDRQKIDFLRKKVKQNYKNIYLAKELLNFSRQNVDQNFLNDLNLFQKNFLKYQQSVGLDKLKLLFIPENIIYGSIGNYENLETLIKAKQLGILDKNLVILESKKISPLNNFLYQMIKKYFTIIKDDSFLQKSLHLSQEKLTLPLGIIISTDKKFGPITVMQNYINSLFYKKFSKMHFLKLSNEDIILGYKNLKKINSKIRRKSFFVTLHVREPSFRGENFQNTQENHRNANIQDYVEAIKTITSKGGYVFRMGQKSSIKLPKIYGLIDYCNSKHKSEFMDIFLAAECKFCIGTGSGFYMLPALLGKPRILTNYPGILEYYALRKGDIFLPRLIKNKKDNKMLNFKQTCAYPISSLWNDKQYEKENLTWVENTPDEIKYATKEMLNSLKNKKFTSSNLQDKIFRILKKTASNYLFKDQNELVCHANISEYFLKRNKSLL